MIDPNRPKANSNRTLTLTPDGSEMLKPAELIEVAGASRLTLADRRLYNTLLHHAHGPELGKPGAEFVISLAELRDSHDSNDRLAASIEALMQTIVTVRQADGSTTRVQLLGANNLANPKRQRGTLTYAIAPQLAKILDTSSIFAKLELEVLRAFSSKYALALYEAVSRRLRLRVTTERFDLETFREKVLAVEPGKLTSYGNLNQYAIKPAVREVNALADFCVGVTPEKQSRKVVGVLVNWYPKDIEARKAAFAELRRPHVGRKARIEGRVEDLIEPDTDTAD